MEIAPIPALDTRRDNIRNRSGPRGPVNKAHANWLVPDHGGKTVHRAGVGRGNRTGRLGIRQQNPSFANRNNEVDLQTLLSFINYWFRLINSLHDHFRPVYPIFLFHHPLF